MNLFFEQTQPHFFADRRAKFSSNLFLLLTVIIFGAGAFRIFTNQSISLDIVIFAATFFAYLTARTRYYFVGSVFLVLAICSVAYSAASKNFLNGMTDVNFVLAGLSLPLLMMPLMFPRRVMIWVASIPVAFLAAFILRFNPQNWGILMGVLTMGMLISIITAHTYDADLELIHNQNVLLQAQNDKLLFAYDETLLGWAKMLEMRDKETEGHSERVTKMTLKIADEMGIKDQVETQTIRYGSLLHDIGKIAISDTILHKPAPLTEAEWQVMEQHTEYAYDWLKDIDFLRTALDIPRYHHEKWDGSGYNGLREEQIPLYARIFAVADSWDALTNERPYRKAWSQAQTIDYIAENSGIEFDPQVVEAFLKAVNRE